MDRIENAERHLPIFRRSGFSEPSKSLSDKGHVFLDIQDVIVNVSGYTMLAQLF
jgi:hypothetical protein